ncbi:hypothetical protein COCVIDRAFT_23251 [Bipolaris victoriae FI3]|uniref:Hyaluronan/mRNA-binding protein domain-containing protein n=1 Tax=Bipolaris victoriae (strain FI3) TaxID=930091 RepID=W7EKY9_BIPV3|nr:hypothetical protein COCVIDRAFT_23251 [Bipolaris victoriae FI3]
MSQIASKNIYELLGNDPELDPNRPADPPTRAIEKPVMRHGKRDGSDLPKSIPERQSHQNRAKQTDNANENAFRDRGVGSDKNRGRGSGEPTGTGARGGQRGRGRGGRGGGRGGARGEGDRHSRTGISEHDKQVAHGWGGKDGDAELADEQAGEAIAQAEEKDAIREDAEGENAEPEPEDKSKSYAAYLAELAEKKLSLAAQNVRKANEGSSQKFPEGTALSRDDQEDFIAGGQGKAKRERARKEKVHVELDGDRMLAPPPREGGGRGRGRGRGEFRGGEGRGRGNGEGRGRGEGRGEFRGRGRGGETRGRGDARGRGGRGGAPGPNITDSSAFPSLGA